MISIKMIRTNKQKKNGMIRSIHKTRKRRLRIERKNIDDIDKLKFFPSFHIYDMVYTQIDLSLDNVMTYPIIGELIPKRMLEI